MEKKIKYPYFIRGNCDRGREAADLLYKKCRAVKWLNANFYNHNALYVIENDDFYSEYCINSFTAKLIQEHFEEVHLPPVDKQYDFKPFDRVLVRDIDTDKWHIDLFQKDGGPEHCHRFECLAENWKQCIPYEGNKHLLGTTNNVD